MARKDFDLIMVVVNKGDAPEAVKAAQKVGAKGATIINGRGSGIHENAKIFGFPIEPEKEIIMIATTKNKTEHILEAITKEIGLDRPGKGIAFVLDADRVIGI